MPCTTSVNNPRSRSATWGRPSTAFVVISRRHTHNRTSAPGRLQSRANASTLAGTTSREAEEGRGTGSSYCPNVVRARCPTAEPSCRPVRIGPIVAIHRDTRSAGPIPRSTSAPARSSGPRSINPRPVGVSSAEPPSVDPVDPVSGLRSPPVAPFPAPSGLSSKRNRQSSTVRHAHAPGPTVMISTGAPVGVTESPVSSAMCSSATRANSSNWIRSEGSTLPSGWPFVAAP